MEEEEKDDVNINDLRNEMDDNIKYKPSEDTDRYSHSFRDTKPHF